MTPWDAPDELPMTGSGVEPGSALPPDESVPGPASGLKVGPPVPCPVVPFWPADAAAAAWTSDTFDAPQRRQRPPRQTRGRATGARARHSREQAAEEPPALLAAGVDAGNLNGVIAPLADAPAGPEALDPPRGGRRPRRRLAWPGATGLRCRELHGHPTPARC